jgi:lipid-A-disaccharide synthase
MSGLSFFISAGEASGERYGALLISELKEQLQAQNSEAEFFGMGGPGMAAAGLERIVRSEDVAVMGITEVVRHLPRIYREFRRLKAAIRARRPSVAILIDFPDIHFKLAKEFHRLGVPVIFFVSPQLWAWKKHRIKLVQKYVDKMLVIFPFEEAFYRDHGVAAEFVGHPLAELPLPSTTRTDFAGENGLDPMCTWIGLLPGSRAKEIRDNLPTMLAAARQLTATASASESPFQFVLPLAPTLKTAHKLMAQRLAGEYANQLSIRLVDNARTALFHARASIVASGTATVEAALIGNPFIVVYRVSPITYAIARQVVSVPHVAMANLIAGKRVVPELIQKDFTASNIVRELQPLLPDGPPRESMKRELARVRGLLTEQSGAISRVAAITLRQVQGRFDEPSLVSESVQSSRNAVVR